MKIEQIFKKKTQPKLSVLLITVYLIILSNTLFAQHTYIDFDNIEQRLDKIIRTTINTENNASGSDSINYKYDNTNRPTSSLGEMLEPFNYEYNSGNLLLSKSQQSIFGNDTSVYLFSYEYNSNNSITRKDLSYYKNNILQTASNFEFINNDSVYVTILTRLNVYVWGGSDSAVYFRKGLRVDSIHYYNRYDLNSIYVLSARYIYSYENENQTGIRLKYNRASNVTEKMYFTYEDDYRITSEIVYDGYDTPISRSSCQFDSLGNLLLEIDSTYSKYYSAWKFEQKINYTYDYSIPLNKVGYVSDEYVPRIPLWTYDPFSEYGLEMPFIHMHFYSKVGSITYVSSSHENLIYYYNFYYLNINSLSDNLEKSISKELNIYPNPAQNILYVNYYDTDNQFDITIYDISGNKVLNKKISALNPIDISRLPKGVYVLNAYVDGNLYTSRLIKEK